MDIATRRRSLQYFQNLSSKPEEQIELAAAALEIARPEYPELDRSWYLNLIAELASEARATMPPSGSTTDRARALLHFLSVERRFRGNIEDYYSPGNSFLHEVLERHQGLPITLAVVYLEVGSLCGIPLEGVGLPGHFVLRGGDIFIDPFYGVELTETEVQERFKEVNGSDIPFNPAFLETVSKRSMLIRILHNLKHLYIAQDDVDRALSCCERCLALMPDSPPDLRDRGLIFLSAERFNDAITDLERYLALTPKDSWAEPVRKRLEEARQRVAGFH